MPPKKKAKAKAKNAKSELGGEGEYKDKTYEELCKKHWDYVDSIINSRDPLTDEEEAFVDWILNKPDGREMYQKYKGGAGCMAGVACIIQ